MGISLCVSRSMVFFHPFSSLCYVGGVSILSNLRKSCSA
ncbi:hypothetical protein CSUI_007627 [Cystoisospora suis]|uniref:Uncharacterized protein n=1 Tax=Cystoisospora suis TaxID=483139 RepID=A0A2C6KLZ5_9APIC|nr:hypothetical protein CSUI_007627 [Cystoisospora suis]